LSSLKKTSSIIFAGCFGSTSSRTSRTGSCFSCVTARHCRGNWGTRRQRSKRSAIGRPPGDWRIQRRRRRVVLRKFKQGARPLRRGCGGADVATHAEINARFVALDRHPRLLAEAFDGWLAWPIVKERLWLACLNAGAEERTSAFPADMIRRL